MSPLNLNINNDHYNINDDYNILTMMLNELYGVHKANICGLLPGGVTVLRVSVCVCVWSLTSSAARGDGRTVVLEVQGARRVQHRVHEDVRLALLQDVQHLLGTETESKHTHTHTFIELICIYLYHFFVGLLFIQIEPH